MKHRILSLVLCAVVALTLLTACADSGDGTAAQDSAAEPAPTSEGDGSADVDDDNAGDTDTADKQDTFTYAITADPGNMFNIIEADDRFSLMVARFTNSALYTLSSDGSLNYYLAESIEPSEDGLTYTAKLKDGLVWSDGEPLDADDVVFTYETYLAKTRSLYLGDEPITVEKLDELTVAFHLPAASASILETLSQYVLPQHVFEGADSLDVNLLAEPLVGAGAYVFDEYRAGEYISFVKNPSYVNGEAGIGTVVLKIVEDDNTAKLALRSGEIDAWIAPSADQLDGLEEFTVVPYSEGRVAYLRLNRVAESMQNKDFRKGIFYAVDREEVLTAAYASLEYATPSYSFLPKTNKFYSEDIEKYEQDLDRASELLAAGTTTSLKLCYNAADSTGALQAAVIQAELSAVGIDLELFGVDQAAYMAAAYDLEDDTYDMYLGGYVMTIDADGYSGMFDSTKDGMINYNNDRVDELFALGSVELDEQKRAAIYQELQEVIAEEALFYPIGTNLRLLVVNSSVTGFDEAGFAPVHTFEDISKLYFQ